MSQASASVDLLLRGYRAFVAGDLDTIESLLDPEVEWVGVGEVSMRFSRTETDPTDERPLQSRRMFLVGRYAAIVTIRDGRVVRVDEQPSLTAALEVAGVEEDAV